MNHLVSSLMFFTTRIAQRAIILAVKKWQPRQNIDSFHYKSVGSAGYRMDVLYDGWMRSGRHKTSTAKGMDTDLFEMPSSCWHIPPLMLLSCLGQFLSWSEISHNHLKFSFFTNLYCVFMTKYPLDFGSFSAQSGSLWFGRPLIIPFRYTKYHSLLCIT